MRTMTVHDWIITDPDRRPDVFWLVPGTTPYNYARVSKTGQSARVGVLMPGQTQLRITRYVPLDTVVFVGDDE